MTCTLLKVLIDLPSSDRAATIPDHRLSHMAARHALFVCPGQLQAWAGHAPDAGAIQRTLGSVPDEPGFQALHASLAT